jgi:UDP-glucose 4-epimerase
VLTGALSDENQIEGIDRVWRSRAGVRRVNMAHTRSLRKLFAGADAVIDLAAHASEKTPWEDVLRNNIPATTNAFEAARLAGVRRVLFASSGRVTGMYEHDDPYSRIIRGDLGGLDPATLPRITSSWPVRPDSPYAIGKAAGEAAARYYSDTFGLSIICLRIGTVNAQNAASKPRHCATLLTHGDLVRLVRAALSAPDELRFGIYYGVSRNTWRIWDIDDSERELGYMPQDDAETFRATIEQRSS